MTFVDCPECGMERIYEGVRLCTACEVNERWNKRMTDMESTIYEARAHLGAVLIQAIPSDEQIIIGHVRDAFELLGGRVKP